MKKSWRLLMAGTVLSGLAGLGTAHAANNSGLLGPQDATQSAPIILAQAQPQDDEKKRTREQRQQEKQEKRQDQRQEQRQNRPNDAQPGASRGNTDRQGAGNQNNRNQEKRNQDNRGNRDAQDKRNRDAPDNRGNRDARPASPPPPPAATQASPPPPPAATQASPPPPPAATSTDRGNQNRDANQNRERNRDGNRNEQTRDRDKRDTRDPAATTTRDQDNRDRSTTTTRERERDNNRQQTEDNTKPIESGGKGKGVAAKSSSGNEVRSVQDIKEDRKVSKEGNRTIIKEPGGKTIIKEGNRTIIRHDETARFRQGARDVRVERVGNGSRTVIIRPNGDRIVTVTDNNGRLLRRSRILDNGREVIIIDNRPRAGSFFVVLPPPRIRIPRDRYIVAYRDAPPALIYETLTAPPVEVIDRPYSLEEIRYSPAVRDRMPRIDLNDINFETGSWELSQQQIEKLAAIADGMKRAIEQNPQIVFLIEGHTDAVGNDDDNLSLSDRRAESVAVALTEEFQVPPENLTTQGYGEQHLKVPTEGPEEANRRVTVRNIAPLLAGKGAAPGEPRPQ